MSFCTVELFNFNIFHLRNPYGPFLSRKKRIFHERVCVFFFADVWCIESSSNLPLNSKWIESNYKRPKSEQQCTIYTHENYHEMRRIEHLPIYPICCASWFVHSMVWHGLFFSFLPCATHKHGKWNACNNTTKVHNWCIRKSFFSSSSISLSLSLFAINCSMNTITNIRINNNAHMCSSHASIMKLKRSCGSIQLAVNR